ncbi:MAG: DUF4239 domain-containing protein [Bacteroidia bacterium]|nr:DUF4239 domain-containing protein [Bacteroidia bacterium]
MDITHHLAQLSPYLLFFLVISVGGIIGGLGTFLFRKYVRLIILRAHNEVTGFLYLSISSFYALLLSFIVFVFWAQLNETRSNASKEGSAAIGVYRDIKNYPDTVDSKKLMTVFLVFVRNAVDEELQSMKEMKLNRKTIESYNRVYNKIENVNPKTPYQVQLLSEMCHDLNELSTYRGLHIIAMEAAIPTPMWLPMLLGGFITLLCAMMLDIEYKRLHILLNSLLGIFIGMFFFIIILLNHPYTGSLGIKPESYNQIFTMEK